MNRTILKNDKSESNNLKKDNYVQEKINRNGNPDQVNSEKEHIAKGTSKKGKSCKGEIKKG